MSRNNAKTINGVTVRFAGRVSPVPAFSNPGKPAVPNEYRSPGNHELGKRVVLFGVFCFVFAGAALANFDSVFEFEGFYHYSGSGEIAPLAEIAAAGFNGDLPPDPNFGEDGPYYGVGALAYQLDLNLPEPDEKHSWSLDYQLRSNGEENKWVAAAGDYVYTTTNTDESGAQPLAAFSAGMTEADVVDFLSSIPTSGYITSMRTFVGDLGAQLGLTPADMADLLEEIDEELGSVEYLHVGDANPTSKLWAIVENTNEDDGIAMEGLVLWAMDENVYDNDPVEYERASFAGSIRLSATAIPEPSTLQLFLAASVLLAASRCCIFRLRLRRSGN
jgi:hypothetical protein